MRNVVFPEHFDIYEFCSESVQVPQPLLYTQTVNIGLDSLELRAWLGIDPVQSGRKALSIN